MVNEEFSIYGRDPELRSLRELTVANLQAELARNVPRALLDQPPSRYQISALRYSPRKKLVLGLGADGGKKPIAIRIFPRKALADRLASAQRMHPHHAFLLDSIDAVAWVFPGERKLQLGLLADRKRVAAIVEQHRGYALERMELVHCVPEHTFTVRVHGRRDDGTETCEYLKIYYNDQGDRTARLMRQLAGRLDAASIRFPDDVTYLPAERMLIQPALPRDTKRRLDNAEVADALARMHGLPLDAPESGDPDPGEAFESVRHLVADTFPELLETLARIDGDIRSALQDTPQSLPVLLHGDAHLGNLFPLVGGGIGVIDLDRMRRGPAEDDLASYFAFCLWLDLRNGGRVRTALRVFPPFVRAYNRVAAKKVSLRRAWFMLAHKMIAERVRRGIARGKFSSGGEIADFARIACHCLEFGRRTRD